jgi:integrase
LLQKPTYIENRYVLFRVCRSQRLSSLIARVDEKPLHTFKRSRTGARSGEISKLKWTDINEVNSTISINTPEKGSDTRTIRVSPKTIAMLKALPNKYDPYVFNPRSLSMKEGFQIARNRLAATLHNRSISSNRYLHTFRHWKATMEYHKTKDPLHVIKVLGHRNIQSTLVYAKLVNFENGEYHAATAKTLLEAKALIESGFEYVCDMDNCKLFRKRK